MVKRVPTNYAVKREQKRYIARKNMKDAGMVHIGKHSYRNPSEFSQKWKDYVEVE